MLRKTLGLMLLLLAQLEDIILQQMGKGMYDENKVIELFPVKRMGKPQEIANGILWLCSDESLYGLGHRRGL
jgi:NAD(P)-dependent dehydrogenase (short-subunit alcohol dehydrogenase family)